MQLTFKTSLCGFTLMEIMVVIGITALLIVVSFPLYTYFQTFNVALAERQELIEDLRLVEAQAQQGLNDSAFGISVTSASSYTLYQGATYQTRNQSKDIVRSLPTNITVSGISEINFQKKTGLPSTTGTFTITHTANNAQKIITINSQGLIQ